MIKLKLWIVAVSISVLASISAFTLFNSNISVFGNHFGSVIIYSDVYTGGGNSSNPINEFDPVKKEIYSGETVKWSNPTAGIPFPHMVTFVSNQSIEINSKILNITKSLQSSNPQDVISNLNKFVQHDQENDNSNQSLSARSIVLPSVINSTDLKVTYLNPSGNNLYKGAEYNYTGNESFLNSGIIWAGGVIPDKFAKINSFMVTFKNPGTYYYQCLIYPEMKGVIIVKPNPGRLGIQLN